MGLGQEITKATGGRVKLDRSTENLLAFNANGSKSGPDSATGAAQGDAKPAEEKRDQFWDRSRLLASIPPVAFLVISCNTASR
jgi:hypothetical protein